MTDLPAFLLCKDYVSFINEYNFLYNVKIRDKYLPSTTSIQKFNVCRWCRISFWMSPLHGLVTGQDLFHLGNWMEGDIL
jgi:hypothetical protein